MLCAQQPVCQSGDRVGYSICAGTVAGMMLDCLAAQCAACCLGGGCSEDTWYVQCWHVDSAAGHAVPGPHAVQVQLTVCRIATLVWH
jgi:hypothetical protein